MRHFPPTFDDEVYVLCRYNEERLVLLIMNNDEDKKVIKPNHYINQVKPSKDNVLGFDVVQKTEININNEVNIPSRSFLLIDLYY